MDDWQPAPEQRDTQQEPLRDDAVCGFDVNRIGADTGATVVGYDHEVDPVEVAIPSLVAHCESTDPCGLPPLYDAVDPEALAALFADDRGVDSAIGVTFQYAGYTVAIGEQMLAVRVAD